MSLNIAIVGAGISGLATAISLRRSGHKVTLYERSSLNRETGAAINVPPNATRFLIPWGLDPVKARFVASEGMSFLSPGSLETLAHFDYSQTEKTFGAQMLYAHRVDLHESLKRMATEQGPGAPATVLLRSAVVKYDPNTPSITLQDGRVIAADLVIAADGLHSIAVESVLGKTNPPEPAKHENCCYRFLICRKDLESDLETKWLTEERTSSGAFLFPDSKSKRRLVTYTCRNHEVHNFAAICWNDNIMTKREDWHCSVDKAELLERYADYSPSILAVINKAAEVKRWPLLYRPPIPTWHKGNLVLAGDAAHPMLPHHAQGGAQGLEDGIALGLVFSGVSDPAEIPMRLKLYETIRRNRASSVQILSNTGYEEEAPGELGVFLEGGSAPVTVRDMFQMEYGHDVVKRSIETMKAFDPRWCVPEGFFPGARPEILDSVSNSSINGKVKEG